MTKPVYVLIQLNNTLAPERLWSGIIDLGKPALKTEIDGTVMTILLCEKYDLADHQFIRLDFKIEDMPASVLMPRHLVLGVVEGVKQKNLSGFLTPAKKETA